MDILTHPRFPWVLIRAIHQGFCNSHLRVTCAVRDGVFLIMNSAMVRLLDELREVHQSAAALRCELCAEFGILPDDRMVFVFAESGYIPSVPIDVIKVCNRTHCVELEDAQLMVRLSIAIRIL